MNSPLTIPVKNALSHIVVVGNGMVGQHLVEQLVQKNAHLEHRITVIGAERFIAYDRVQLSSLFAGKSHDDLMLSNQEWYDMHGIQLVLGSQVTGIDREQKRILLDGEDVLGYDELVLATGSYHLCRQLKVKTATTCLSTVRLMTFHKSRRHVKVQEQVQ